MLFRIILLINLLLFLLPACNKPEKGKLNYSKQVHDKTQWSYEGNEDPSHWAELSPEFIKCAEGHFQSPIDLESYSAEKYHGDLLEFKYHPSTVDLFNNGHTIQAIIEAQDEILIANGHEYLLKQVHFHAPSEHQIDGIIYPMEMHMVHADESGKLAVVGIFIKEGISNEELNTLWKKIPEQVEEHAHPTKTCDLLNLIPDTHPVFHYSGSLTTPPCSEGVEWFVLEKPIELSKAQISIFKKLYHHNNRPIQKRETRIIEVFE